MRLLLYKTTMKKIYKVTIMVYAIIFIIGYLGGFKYMNIVLNHYIEYSDYVMYALIFFLSIGIFYPFLREGFKTFDKEILNEISTVFLIIAFLSVLIQVLLGEEKALSAGIIIKIIIFSPVLEELFNRCAVITILKTILKADNVVCMLISAVIFAMFHINSLKQSGFMPEISNLLIYFILGMGCAYVYLRTNNIVSAIVLHMFWNVSIVGGIISGIAHR
jgi:membrane protease YdiL (CAAX protease family)